jgi:hypothetical protein
VALNPKYSTLCRIEQGTTSRVELVLTRSNFDKRREALLAESTKNLEAATLEVTTTRNRGRCETSPGTPEFATRNPKPETRNPEPATRKTRDRLGKTTNPFE